MHEQYTIQEENHKIKETLSRYTNENKHMDDIDFEY